MENNISFSDKYPQLFLVLQEIDPWIDTNSQKIFPKNIFFGFRESWLRRDLVIHLAKATSAADIWQIAALRMPFWEKLIKSERLVFTQERSDFFVEIKTLFDLGRQGKKEKINGDFKENIPPLIQRVIAQAKVSPVLFFVLSIKGCSLAISKETRRFVNEAFHGWVLDHIALLRGVFPDFPVVEQPLWPKPINFNELEEVIKISITKKHL